MPSGPFGQSRAKACPLICEVGHRDTDSRYRFWFQHLEDALWMPRTTFRGAKPIIGSGGDRSSQGDGHRPHSGKDIGRATHPSSARQDASSPRAGGNAERVPAEEPRVRAADPAPRGRHPSVPADTVAYLCRGCRLHRLVGRLPTEPRERREDSCLRPASLPPVPSRYVRPLSDGPEHGDAEVSCRKETTA